MLVLERTEGDRSELVHWFASRDEAEQWVLNNPPDRYQYLNLYELIEGGGLERVTEWEHIPERYVGPIARRKIEYTRRPGYMHRVPIDCIKPTPDLELTEDCRVRVVETQCCGTNRSHTVAPDHPLSGHCHCVGWFVVEGDPERVDEIAASYA